MADEDAPAPAKPKAKKKEAPAPDPVAVAQAEYDAARAALNAVFARRTAFELETKEAEAIARRRLSAAVGALDAAKRDAS